MVNKKYLNLNQVKSIVLLKVKGDSKKYSVNVLKYCTKDCLKCQIKFEHINFFIKNTTLYAQRFCPNCKYIQSEPHSVTQW